MTYEIGKKLHKMFPPFPPCFHLVKRWKHHVIITLFPMFPPFYGFRVSIKKVGEGEGRGRGGDNNNAIYSWRGCLGGNIKTD